jgi:alpha-L-fucosidase
VPTLVSLLIETASIGGNLLLNVGPMGDGRFPQQSIDGLKGTGEWMRRNGSSIRGSRATPFANAPLRVTSQSRRLNLFIEEWRGGELKLPGLVSAPRRVALLEDPAMHIDAATTHDGLVVTLPDRGPGTLTPVIVLDFDEAPYVTPSSKP